MVLALAAPAAASPLDILGLGSRHAGQANAGIASVDDASALYYNPAGLANHPACARWAAPEGDSDETAEKPRRPKDNDESQDDKPRDDDDDRHKARDKSPDPVCEVRDRGDLLFGVAGGYSHLLIGGVRAPFADAGGAQLAARARIADRLAFAFAFHGPSQGGEHAVVRDPAYPFYPYYRDRLSRPVLLVGAAANFGEASLGASADLGAGTAHPKAILGGTYRLSSALRLGVAYHQRFAIIDEATGARVHYTPHTGLAGVTFTSDAVRASLDLGFAHWSAYEGPFATGTTVRVPYTSSEIVRFGIESNTETGIAFRFGYALETAAIPEEQPDANLLDGLKQLVAGGASYGTGRLRVDAHIGIQIVATRSMVMPDSTKLKSGGEVFTGGLTLALGY